MRSSGNGPRLFRPSRSGRAAGSHGSWRRPEHDPVECGIRPSCLSVLGPVCRRGRSGNARPSHASGSWGFGDGAVYGICLSRAKTPSRIHGSRRLWIVVAERINGTCARSAACLPNRACPRGRTALSRLRLLAPFTPVPAGSGASAGCVFDRPGGPGWSTRPDHSATRACRQ